MSKQEDKLMTTGEVADEFQVNPNTVRRWADTGKLNFIRTPGGHRKFRKSDVNKFLSNNNV